MACVGVAQAVHVYMYACGADESAAVTPDRCSACVCSHACVPGVECTGDQWLSLTWAVRACRFVTSVKNDWRRSHNRSGSTGTDHDLRSRWHVCECWWTQVPGASHVRGGGGGGGGRAAAGQEGACMGGVSLWGHRRRPCMCGFSAVVRGGSPSGLPPRLLVPLFMIRNRLVQDQYTRCKLASCTVAKNAHVHVYEFSCGVVLPVGHYQYMCSLRLRVG